MSPAQLREFVNDMVTSYESGEADLPEGVTLDQYKTVASDILEAVEATSEN